MDNSTAFWSIIFPTLLPFILIIVFFLLWRVIKWLERRKWKPITARVLHIEAIDKKDSVLWSSIFVTLVAKKYRFMQFELDRVFDTH